jgi:probable rRNA maturation factor
MKARRKTSNPPITPTVAIVSTQSALRVPRKRLVELVAFVAGGEGACVAHVDITVVDGKEMAALNQRLLGHRGQTDVISYDLSDETMSGLAIQLIVCGDVAAGQGPLHGYRPQHELMLYVIHGLLHMMGYDDTSTGAAAAMRARQEELLTAFLKRR